MADDLSRDTAVERLDKVPGRWVARLPDHWNYLNASGGVLTTVALRALVAELARPDLVLLSATAMFCSPVRQGVLDVRTTILRSGESAAQVRASVSSRADGGPGVEVLATFCERARDGYATCSGNLWDESGSLAARVAQTMTVRSLER